MTRFATSLHLWAEQTPPSFIARTPTRLLALIRPELEADHLGSGPSVKADQRHRAAVRSGPIRAMGTQQAEKLEFSEIPGARQDG